jgi:hypothetical protein
MRRSYVVPMRWMVIYEYEVPVGDLNLNSTKLSRAWSPWGSSPSGKNPHGRPRNRTWDIMISNQKLWPLDHEAGQLSHVVCISNNLLNFFQYSETNVMHFLFNLSRIKGLYMFWAFLAHPQEALQKRHLVCCVRVMSVGCTRIEVELVQSTRITRTQYTKRRMCSTT